MCVFVCEWLCLFNTHIDQFIVEILSAVFNFNGKSDKKYVEQNKNVGFYKSRYISYPFNSELLNTIRRVSADNTFKFQTIPSS